MADVRDTFVETIIEAAEADRRVVAVSNDSIGSSKLAEFRRRFPERLFNVGIAEQNMVGFGAGLAAVGLIPFVCSATCFLSYRALEQIKNDVVYSKQNVKLVGNTSGVDYGPLGATHHSIEDLGTLRALPGLGIVAPADHEETAEIARWLIGHEGPAYLRLYRANVPESLGMPGRFEFGKVRLLREGSDCTLFASGPMVHRALAAAEMLAGEGLSVGVVNVSTLSPLDVEGVLKAAEQSRCAVAVEDHMVEGGLGSALCEVFSEHGPRPVLRLGYREFAIVGPAEEVRAHYGLTAEGIAGRVRTFLGRIVA